MLGLVACFLLALGLTTRGVLAVCDANTVGKVTYVEINETAYDRNYSSIQDEGKNPLGFYKSIVYYDNSKANPCILLKDTQNRDVQIMFETIPRAKLCVRDQSGSVRCQEGQHQECKSSMGTDMYYEFFCDVSQGCSESDVTFWFRLARGPTTAEDPEGMWCQWRDNLYPSSLATIPPDYSPRPPITKRPINAATHLTMTTFLINLTTLCLAFIF